MKKTLTILATSMFLATPALAQFTIDPTNKFAWGENVGWLNFADAGSPVGSQSVRVAETYLSGYVWGENIGWINLGNTQPANGNTYANATGADFGVNHDPNTGYLSGMAWSENTGWINFAGGAQANPANPARISVDEPRRFYGYAWSENLGWINLDDAGTFVGVNTCPPCPADYNNSGGTPDDADVAAFFNAWNAGEPCADTNASGGTPDDADVATFFLLWNNGGC
ncbi:MAG: hypothetical protein HUU18_04250 [Phycisphaerales bacterium]|nr:hypothetical protein [Phycisphaerales bacterium]